MYSIWLTILPLKIALLHNAQIEETSSFPIWLTIPLVITLLALIFFAIYRFVIAGEVIVGELEVGTVFTRREGDFVKFLRPKKGPYWVDPIRFKTGDKISLGSQNASGECKDLRTKEGIPITIEYNVSFTVDPADALPAIHNKMARALPQHAPNIVAGRVKHVLRHLVEGKSINELYEEGAMKKLEGEVRAEVSERSKVVGVAEITATNMKLGPIHMPQQVEKALKANYERKLQTGTSIEALKCLHEVISQYDEKDMERLAELERLRVIENSGSLVYLMDSLVSRGRDSLAPNGKSKSSVN